MGALQAEAQSVQEENNREPPSLVESLLQKFHSDVSKVPQTFDLNVPPISERALKGALLILSAMHA
jgi:hypothetical protein